MSFIYSLAASWVNAATVYKGIDINVSDGAGGAPLYAAGSKLIDLLNNSVSKFSVDPDGNIYGPGGTIPFVPNFTQLGTGAIARNYQTKVRESFSVQDFGAVGDGVTNDASAIIAATAAASANSKDLIFPPGNYLWTSASTWSIPSFVKVYGFGATITVNVNVDPFMAMATASELHNFTINGTGTGRGCAISAGTDQKFFNVNISGFDNYCLECSPDCGIRFLWVGGTTFRSTVTNPAIRFAGGGGTESTGERKLFGLQAGGGNLIDTAGSQNTNMTSCSMVNFTSSANCVKNIILGCRFGVALGTVTLLGNESIMIGCIVAGNVTLGSGATNWVVGPNVIQSPGVYTDSSGNSTNSIFRSPGIATTITALWKGDVADPAIVNGTFNAKATRNGNQIWAYIEVIMGAGTTFGTGNWYFTLPTPFDAVAAASATGSVFMLDSGTALYTGTCYIATGTNKIYCVINNSANFVNSTVPITWAVNDYIKLSIQFLVL